MRTDIRDRYPVRRWRVVWAELDGALQGIYRGRHASDVRRVVMKRRDARSVVSVWPIREGVEV